MANLQSNSLFGSVHDIMAKGRPPLSLQTIELQVRMCCTGCERVVRSAIYKLRGIHWFTTLFFYFYYYLSTITITILITKFKQLLKNLESKSNM
ncbi:putative heavy metal-associated domain superfamily [Helianthus annuus]|nr:putative heavy metal-associated domain superfamily [Helianthus annuus]